MRNFEYIIWDWNGTLYDDVIAGIDTINSMLSERGLETLSMDRYRAIFGFPIIDYYVRAGFDFSIESYEKLAAIFIERNNARLGMSELYKDARHALDEVSSKGIKQLILSATRQDILKQQTGLFGIGHYFCEVLGNEDFYAYGKTQLARNFIAKNNIDPRKILLIGDTIHDFEVASSVGCDCRLVSAGHQDASILKTANCMIASSLLDAIKDIGAYKLDAIKNI